MVIEKKKNSAFLKFVTFK